MIRSRGPVHPAAPGAHRLRTDTVWSPLVDVSAAVIGLASGRVAHRGRHRRSAAEVAPPVPRGRRYLAFGVRGLLTSVAVAVVSLTGWVLVPSLWGWDAYTVTTGSMAPLVQPGDVVVASQPDGEVDLGTVVVVAPPPERPEPITHRVVERLPDGRYRTKGDANAQPDSRLITADQVIGRVELVVPLAGQVRLRLGEGAPVLGVVVIVGSLLVPVVSRSHGRGVGHPPGQLRRVTRRGAPAVICVVILTVTAVAASWSTTRGGWTRTTSTATNTFATSDFYYPAMIASGPVSYWRLGGSDTTTATDAMGVAALTLVNTPLVQQTGALRGDPDTATGFRRTPAVSYGTVSETQHQIPGTVTVAAWTRTFGTVSGTWRLVFKGTTTNLNYLLSWSGSGTDMRFLVDLTSGSRLTATGTWPTDGGWHFVVGVYDNTAARLYLDGVEKTPHAGTGTLKTSAQPLTVSEPAGTPMNGDVDEVAIWNRPLTPAEISHLYAIGRR